MLNLKAWILRPGFDQNRGHRPRRQPRGRPGQLPRPSSAPVIVLQGDNDHIISPGQSLILLDALRAKRVEGTRVKGADHGDLAFLDDPESGKKWTTRTVMRTITGFPDKKLR